MGSCSSPSAPTSPAARAIEQERTACLAYPCEVRFATGRPRSARPTWLPRCPTCVLVSLWVPVTPCQQDCCGDTVLPAIAQRLEHRGWRQIGYQVKPLLVQGMPGCGRGHSETGACRLAGRVCHARGRLQGRFVHRTSCGLGLTDRCSLDLCTAHYYLAS